MRKNLVSGMVAVALALASRPHAWASEQDAFVSLLRRFGITDDLTTSKKPCLCAGGASGGGVGRLVAEQVGDRFKFDCLIESFDGNGNGTGSSSCVANAGSVVVIPK